MRTIFLKIFRHGTLTFWLTLGIGNVAAQAEQLYFPEGALDKSLPSSYAESRTAFYEKWFGEELRAAKESPLWPSGTITTKDTVFRLTIAPSWTNGLVLRLHIPPDGPIDVIAKLAPGEFGRSFSLSPAARAFQLSERDSAKVRKLLAKLSSKRIPPSDTDDRAWTDGTSLVFELATQGKYRAAERHECDLKTGEPLSELAYLTTRVAKEQWGKFVMLESCERWKKN